MQADACRQGNYCVLQCNALLATPYNRCAMQDLCRKIMGACFTIPDHVSAHARDLLQRMLTVDPLQRITLPQARTSLYARSYDT